MVMYMLINMKNVNLTNHFSLSNQDTFSLVNQRFAKTEFSGAGDKIHFDGNTLLLECENNEYVYISGFDNFQIQD